MLDMRDEVEILGAVLAEISNATPVGGAMFYVLHNAKGIAKGQLEPSRLYRVGQYMADPESVSRADREGFRAWLVQHDVDWPTVTNVRRYKLERLCARCEAMAKLENDDPSGVLLPRPQTEADWERVDGNVIAKKRARA